LKLPLDEQVALRLTPSLHCLPTEPQPAAIALWRYDRGGTETRTTHVSIEGVTTLKFDAAKLPCITIAPL
jgi:hypothetical protein